MVFAWIIIGAKCIVTLIAIVVSVKASIEDRHDQSKYNRQC